MLQKPQVISLVAGGWVVLFGLVGAINSSPNTIIQPDPKPKTKTTLKVLPPISDPTPLADQLQGAGSLQGQDQSTLQQPSDDQLQRNSGLSDFPSNSGPLQ